MLRRRGPRNLNVRAALFHVLGDAVGALAVIVGGVGDRPDAPAWIDPMLSLFVAAIIVVGVVRLMRDATDVLLESVPSDVDSERLADRMARIGGVTGVHDLHVWSIGSGSYALSAHVLLDDRRLSEATDVLREIDACAMNQLRNRPRDDSVRMRKLSRRRPALTSAQHGLVAVLAEFCQ